MARPSIGSLGTWRRRKHLRAKPGEFLRVEIWKVICNTMVMEDRRCTNHVFGYRTNRDVPAPSAVDMRTMGVSIATQAKIDMAEHPDKQGREVLEKATETWAQTLSVNSRDYKITIAPAQGPKHDKPMSLSVMHIVHKGTKVCVARKQQFGGMSGNAACQPYLGVQLTPSEKSAQKFSDDAMGLQSFLDTQGLLLLLVCIAWSEETVTTNSDLTDKFIQAMRTDSWKKGSANDMGLSVNWDTHTMKERLHHVPYVGIHNWDLIDDDVRLGEDADDDDED
eukprot:NODE_13757_length_1148_cov_6.780607.p1 GENE.NODE_13757_length_1148_cov_6.780607~~NODE_13757_length_1148_cov_6.780607.p1  ORF type:complete len:279 (+),score=52.99 NODE_13757_length_1148_cov_6.780607:97-933(+)